jgi:phage gp45-like
MNLGSQKDVMVTGIVTGREVKKNKDGRVEKLLLQVQITEPDDIQTVEFMNQAGSDINPPDGARVLITQNGDSYKIAICSDDNIVPSMNAGEQKIYSTNAGSIAAFINLLSTGNIELNGNANTAVAFAALATAFNQLKSDFNSHIHTGVTTGGGTSGTPQTPTAADIAPAEVTEVKLP